MSPKAIYVRDVFMPIREELPPVAKADELSLDFGQAVLRPGQFSTGDFFCRVSAHDERAAPHRGQHDHRHHDRRNETVGSAAEARPAR